MTDIAGTGKRRYQFKVEYLIEYEGFDTSEVMGRAVAPLPENAQHVKVQLNNSQRIKPRNEPGPIVSGETWESQDEQKPQETELKQEPTQANAEYFLRPDGAGYRQA